MLKLLNLTISVWSNQISWLVWRKSLPSNPTIKRTCHRHSESKSFLIDISTGDVPNWLTCSSFLFSKNCPRYGTKPSPVGIFKFLRPFLLTFPQSCWINRTLSHLWCYFWWSLLGESQVYTCWLTWEDSFWSLLCCFSRRAAKSQKRICRNDGQLSPKFAYSWDCVWIVSNYRIVPYDKIDLWLWKTVNVIVSGATCQYWHTHESYTCHKSRAMTYHVHLVTLYMPDLYMVTTFRYSRNDVAITFLDLYLRLTI